MAGFISVIFLVVACYIILAIMVLTYSPCW